MLAKVSTSSLCRHILTPCIWINLKPDQLILRIENQQLKIPAFTDQKWDSLTLDSGLASSTKIPKPTTTDARNEETGSPLGLAPTVTQQLVRHTTHL